jgi:hypothetical protein
MNGLRSLEYSADTIRNRPDEIRRLKHYKRAFERRYAEGAVLQFLVGNLQRAPICRRLLTERMPGVGNDGC